VLVYQRDAAFAPTTGFPAETGKSSKSKNMFLSEHPATETYI
jgi:hypothetical protein